RHTSSYGDWSSDVCSSDLAGYGQCQSCLPQRPVRGFLQYAAWFDPEHSRQPHLLRYHKQRENCSGPRVARTAAPTSIRLCEWLRSEERRVGKGCERRYAPV